MLSFGYGLRTTDFWDTTKTAWCHCTMDVVFRLRTTDYGLLMKWLFRPSILVLLSGALALSAMTLVLWPRPLDDRAIPLAVQDGDQEIAWLYTATSYGPWERLIKGVETVVERLHGTSADL